MINLNTQNRYKDVPVSLTSDTCKDLIAQVIISKDGSTVKSHYNYDPVRGDLRTHHGNKCVYCESIPIASSAFRVDHYRPKDKIDEVLTKYHKGYYWLGYEWSNLLQSCETCNGKKSNKFPLKKGSVRIDPTTHPNATDYANRVITSELLKSEQRLLVHPELDNVEECFGFERDGKIIGLNEEGKESIKVLGLNREDLILMRKKKVDLYWSDLVEILNDFEDRGADSIAEKFLFFDLVKYFKKLLREQEISREYSRLGFFMFHHFEMFYIDRLPDTLDQHKRIVNDFYLKIKNGN